MPGFFGPVMTQPLLLGFTAGRARKKILKDQPASIQRGFQFG